MKLKGFFIVFYSVVLVSMSAIAQVVTTDPEFPTATDAVTITFDATGSALEGYTGDLYVHTGVTIEGVGQWQNVIGTWGNNSTQPQLTRTSTDIYSLEISSSINDYYGIETGENVTELCFVFRSSDGNTQTSDIFTDVYPPGLSISITSPVQDYIITPGDQVSINASSNDADSMFLYIDDILITKIKGTSINYNHTENDAGSHKIKVYAKNTDEDAADSVYYFAKGSNIEAELPIGWIKGINYLSDDSVGLVLFAPNKEYVFVIGDFTDWRLNEDFMMKRTPDGEYYWLGIGGLTPKKEYIFQYYIDGEIRIADPYTEKTSDPNDKYITDDTYPGLIDYPENETSNVASVLQTNQDEYVWKYNTYNKAEKENLIIYELLVRDFLAKHDYKTLTDTLDYLDSLGINAIELMPVSEFEGNESWGYNPSFYFAPDKYYGQKNDLKAFIDSCHSRGIAVIMDMVLNHSYGQSPLVRMYYDSETYLVTSENPWYNVESPNTSFSWGYDFNHESEYTKEFVDSVNSYWLEYYKIDGFRFDFTKGFTNTTGDGSAYDASRIAILERMADKIWDVNSTAYVILEHLTVNSEEKELAAYGMMLWGNINYEYNEATMGYSSDIDWASYKERTWSEPNLVAYMESHDEERLMYKNIQYGNSAGDYDIKVLNTGLQRIELAANFFIPIPGPKMIWQFGELGYDISIDYGGRVSNKPIHWDYFTSNRKKLYFVFKALNNLKTKYEVFSTDSFEITQSENLKSIHLYSNDMDVIILGNFDVEQKDIDPDFPSTGSWYEFYSGDTLDVSSTNEIIALDPGEYRLYTSTKLYDPNIPLASKYEIEMYSQNLNVYPNPSSGKFYFDTDDYNAGTSEIYIFNLNGQLKINKQSNESILELDASKLDTGLYFYKLVKNGKVYTGKVMKQ